MATRVSSEGGTTSRKSQKCLLFFFVLAVVSYSTQFLLQNYLLPDQQGYTTLLGRDILINTSTCDTQKTCVQCARPLNDKTYCHDQSNEPKVAMRASSYWVFYNLIRPSLSFKCNETVTFSTHGDRAYLSVLEPLIKRWQGPVSMAMYVPGEEFERTIKAIFYYRDCLPSDLISRYVSFHLFLPVDHMPGDGVDMIDMSGFKQNPCNYTQSDIAPRDYRGNLRLTYPVSIARNIAWVASTTHFVLTSDIELLPNPSLIQDFLALIARNDASLQAVRRKVFVPPVFVHRDGNQSMPETKLELIKMEKQGAVRPFFKDYCLRCHRIPNYKGWIKDSNPDKMRIFSSIKRLDHFRSIEPMFIGTRKEPLFDERLSIEGMSDKMTQGYAMCQLNYSYMYLSNAFLIHRLGKPTRWEKRNSPLKRYFKGKASVQGPLIRNHIKPQIRRLFGMGGGVPGCR